MRGMAIGGGRAQAKSTEALGQLSGSKAGLWEGRAAVLKQRGETPGNCNVMRDGVVCRKMGGQDAEQVVGADPGLALVQPDTRMGPKRGGEGIVEHPDAFWRGDDVNVVQEGKDGLPILELSVQVVQGGVLC